MVICSPPEGFSMAGSEIRTPEASPVTYPPSVPTPYFRLRDARGERPMPSLPGGLAPAGLPGPQLRAGIEAFGRLNPGTGFRDQHQRLNPATAGTRPCARTLTGRNFPRRSAGAGACRCPGCSVTAKDSPTRKTDYHDHPRPGHTLIPPPHLGVDRHLHHVD